MKRRNLLAAIGLTPIATRLPSAPTVISKAELTVDYDEGVTELVLDGARYQLEEILVNLRHTPSVTLSPALTHNPKEIR